MSLVIQRFILSGETQKYLRTLEPNFGFGEFGQIVFYRTYSRNVNGHQESWSDVVIRVTQGIFSIRKDYYMKNKLYWSDENIQEYAKEFAISMFNMNFLPPGRGLWAAGTEFVYERGSAALNNCGAATTKDLVLGLTYIFDMLMNGCGIGSDTAWEGKNIIKPNYSDYQIHFVQDSREGWVESLKILLLSYLDNKVKFPVFDYSKVRPKGSPLKGFGGTSSGPDPLKRLHKQVVAYLETYIDFTNAKSNKDRGIVFENLIWKLRDIDYVDYGGHELQIFAEKVRILYLENPNKKQYNSVRCIVDLVNSIGICVVAGNVRRSSELVLGQPDDEVFRHLKDYNINPERQSIGWMSNNTVKLSTSEDFKLLPKLSERIKDNGEPGILNQLNVNRYGRVGHMKPDDIRAHHDSWNRELEEDSATMCNPCITADTFIKTNKGFYTVKNLIGKPFIAVVDGKEYPSTNKGFWHTGFKQVYKLTLKNGFSLKATGDHEIYTTEGKIPLLKLTDEHQISIIEIFDEPSISTIDSIISIGEENVYDCTINEVHCFIANSIKISNCSEISLESFELCNLSATFPTRCLKDGILDEDKFFKALEFATFYSSTVSLLPTHWEITNSIIARNRRIGIGLSGVADYYDKFGATELTRLCRAAYKKVREVNTKLAKEAGVPSSIRVTTIKPDGSISQLTGTSPGVHFPAFRYAIRRMRISETSELIPLLKEAGYKYERDHYESSSTLVFEFPIDQSNTRSALEVNMWEQFALLTTMQREYADNMVSVTIYFNPDTEGDQLEHAIAQHIPQIKSVSILPHTKTGKYKQMPYESISFETYKEMISKIKKIDFQKFGNSDGQIPKFCSNDSCEL